jgi:hypothetical protein
MKQKAPSECDGKKIGTPCSAVKVDAKTKQGRKHATHRLGLTFRSPKEERREWKIAAARDHSFRKEKNKREQCLAIGAKARAAGFCANQKPAKTLRAFVKNLLVNGWELDRVANHFGLTIQEAEKVERSLRSELNALKEAREQKARDSGLAAL